MTTAPSPPVAELPERPDLEALTCTATREPEFGNRLKAALAITEYADALLTRASGLISENQRLKDEVKQCTHMIDVKSSLLLNIADTLRSRGIDASRHMDERVIELAQRMDKAEASAQSAMSRVAELERDADRLRKELRRASMGEIPIDTLLRWQTAFPVLKTMLNVAEISGGAVVAEQMMEEIERAISKRLGARGDTIDAAFKA